MVDLDKKIYFPSVNYGKEKLTAYDKFTIRDNKKRDGKWINIPCAQCGELTAKHHQLSKRYNKLNQDLKKFREIINTKNEDIKFYYDWIGIYETTVVEMLNKINLMRIEYNIPIGELDDIII